MTLSELIYKVARRMYQRTRRNFGIAEIIPVRISVVRTPDRTRRLNLVIPAISERRVFGGVATALRLFNALLPEFDAARIVVLNESQDSFESSRWQQWSPGSPDAMRTITFLGGGGVELLVTDRDYFIATMWTTAVLVQRILASQAATFDEHAHRFLYLIQDFEPGFYPWSDCYISAESTYRVPEHTIAVFNTRLLADYFRAGGFRFAEEFVFEPVFNRQLRQHRDSSEAVKERLIVVYGRPTTPRNCFDVLVDGLKLWAGSYAAAAAWTVVSVGEPHANTSLGAGVILHSKAKLSLSEYADYLARASVGLALMASPHPSYPPLEMAEFGCAVITNTFANKDLSRFSPKIRNLEAVTAKAICDSLSRCCDAYEPVNGAAQAAATSVFLGEDTEFPFLSKLIDTWAPDDHLVSHTAKGRI